MGKETWVEKFDKELGEESLDFPFSAEIRETFLDKKIKQFIKTTLEDMLDEIVGEELNTNKHSGDDVVSYVDIYNDCVKQIKAKGLKYISK